tara:strand:- start:354 stop:695 length:342 start_codon:yes stop_codon:yes gene_type:complete
MAEEIIEKELWDHYSELPNPAWYEYKNKLNKNMRIDLSILNKICDELGPMEVGSSFEKDSITLRFGYWKKIDLEKLMSLLPHHMQAIENLVDEDEECGGELWNYVVKRAHIKI